LVLGYALHTLKLSSGALTLGVAKTRYGWLKANWSSLLIRGVLIIFLWHFYIGNSAIVVGLLAHIGINFNLSLPVTKATSFFVGFGADGILDFIATKVPFLAHSIPTEN